ncbi:TPA: hypothetical protein DCZ32_00505 [Candidatus Uhrbacteria bacterium]|nr:hypothetical protein [Candidatus Uhrbacteria bacterium]
MHTKHFYTVLLLLASLTLAGAGCGQKASESTDTAPTSSQGSKTSDACGNPYYPFKPGLTIAYSVTPPAGVAGDSDFTTRIISVSGTKAKVSVELAGGLTADMEADCASGSVALNGSSGLDSAMEGVKFKTTVISSSGTFMPANVKTGSTWSNSETIKMEITEGPTANFGPITITTTENSKAVSEESVTVPAGTYKAVKVELTRTSKSEFSGAYAINMPETTSTSTEWWVKGIGMVKTITVTDGETSTTEAKSVTGQ